MATSDSLVYTPLVSQDSRLTRTLNTSDPSSTGQTVRLVILRQEKCEVLLQRNGGCFHAPFLDIPLAERPTRFVTETLKKQRNLEIVTLFIQTIGSDPLTNTNRLYHVAELRSWEQPTESAFSWVQRDDIPKSPFTDPLESNDIAACLQQADAYLTDPKSWPFARPGWMDELIIWAGLQVTRFGLSLTGKYWQYGGGPQAVLVRLQTTGRALWFKSFRQEHTKDLEFFATVARNHQDCSPEIIAISGEWRGILMFDIEGVRLDSSSDLRDWRQALKATARFQITHVENCCPCAFTLGHKRGWDWVLDSIGSFFTVVLPIMARQSKVPPPRLTEIELQELAPKVAEVCRKLKQLKIPDSVVHGDYGPHNILIKQDDVFLIDWFDSYIGFPFVLVEYVLATLERTEHPLSRWAPELRAAYYDEWQGIVSSESLRWARLYTPVVAVLTYALRVAAQPAAWRGKEIQREKVLRSLVRRIEREMRSVASLERT